jgi:hypothetical protein
VARVLKVDAEFAPPIFAIFELLILDTLIFRNDPLMDDMDEMNALEPWSVTKDPAYEEILDPSSPTKDPECTCKFCMLAL